MPAQIALALGQRQTAQIDTVLKQQVEREKRHPRHIRPVPPHFSVKGNQFRSAAAS